jgi:hypothetical protein
LDQVSAVSNQVSVMNLGGAEDASLGHKEYSPILVEEKKD